eukprot:gene5403-4547_t
MGDLNALSPHDDLPPGTLAALRSTAKLRRKFMRQEGDTVDHAPMRALLVDLIGSDAEGAAQLALLLHKSGAAPLDALVVAELFVERSCIKQATQYLMAVISAGAAPRGALETRMLEVNLLHAPPQVADALLGSGSLGQY